MPCDAAAPHRAARAPLAPQAEAGEPDAASGRAAHTAVYPVLDTAELTIAGGLRCCAYKARRALSTRSSLHASVDTPPPHTHTHPQITLSQSACLGPPAHAFSTRDRAMPRAAT